MRSEFWQARAEQLAPFSGKGFAFREIAEKVGLTTNTVAKYGRLYGFDFGSYKTEIREPFPAVSGIVENIKRCASEGKTRDETAVELGIPSRQVGNYGRKLGLTFVHGRTGQFTDLPRAEAMAAMYQGGKTLVEIGNFYGITRERVRQIIKKHHGLVGQHGGQHVKAIRSASMRLAAKDRDCLKKYGCTYEQYRGLVEIGKNHPDKSYYRGPTGAWQSQKANASIRGIEWSISLWDWWQIWQKSGKWEARGREVGQYVMCRFGDTGAYAVGNVYIATASHNCSVQPNHPRSRKNFPFSSSEARSTNPPIKEAAES